MPAATGNTFFFPWEVDLMTWLQARLGPDLSAVFSFFSMFGEQLILILILGLLYWDYDKHLGKTVGLSVLMGLVWSPMIKNVFLRRRPYFDHEGIRILRAVDAEADIYDISAQGYSFPSGHSTNASAAYGAIALGARKKWMTVLAVAVPLLVGFSRVAVGAHYPTDVLAGWLVGAAAMLLIPALERRIRNTALFYGILLITAVPGLFYCKSADYFAGFGLMIGFMGGTLVEEKYIRFENATHLIGKILRPVGGAAVYFLLNTLLKMPFSKEFLSSGSTAALLVRCGRYAVIAFVIFGVYPLLFRLVDDLPLGKKESAAA